MNSCRVLFVLLALFGVFAPSGGGYAALAEDVVPAPWSEDEAEQFVSGLTTTVYQIMNNNTKTDRQKADALGQLIELHVDISFLARLLLSQEHRATATPSQSQQYDTLAGQFVLALFRDKVSQLGSRQLTVSESRATRRGDYIIRAVVRRKDGGIVDVDWRIRQTPAGPKIINLSANGVSLVLVKRDEFTSIVVNEGFDALLATLSETVFARPSTAQN